MAMAAAASFSSESPHFFKIILANSLTEGKLYLPKKFVRENGDSLLHNRVRLNLPCGAIWNVELKKSDQKFWFDRGWSEFSKFYSLQIGYFLVFRCEGNCSFNVVVFDVTATEIQYPLKKVKAVRIPKIEVEDTEDEEEDEEEEDCVETLCSLRKGRKRVKTEEAAYSSKMESRRNEAAEKVVKKARKFQCGIENPSFMVIMRPSYLQNGNYLSLPKEFAERYLKESREVELQVEGQKKWRWKVWCGVRWAYTRLRTEFKKGWKTFATDNNLQEGDICVFQIIKSSTSTSKALPIPIKVTIFKLQHHSL